ncbi:pentatricopeptide repeat-containing protein [Carex littledalei]|uniref:Pentatricopeptide repeat-containing protein n=1 Tax=Carex littledalei TaxID=544730 RepID=A0A833VCD9_9POAL|nr:pentatricopeptide repeat-containing protein [Carex littledalei]
MQRLLQCRWRAACQSSNIYYSRDTLLKVGVNAFENREHSTHALANSTGHYSSGWVGSLASRIAQTQIVNALRGGEREHASAMLSEIALNNSLSAEDFYYILEYCAEAPDPMFVMETWQTMEKKSVDLNKGICRYIVRALAKGGYTKEALDWLTLLEESNCTGNTLPVFNVFLNGSSGTKKLRAVKKCLDKMDSQFIGKSEITYWELLKLAVSQKNLLAVNEIWMDCTKYYTPSIVTLRKFIWSFAKLGDLDAAHNILQHMVKVAATHSGAPIRVSCKHRCQSSRLDIPIPALIELPDLMLLPGQKSELGEELTVCQDSDRSKFDLEEMVHRLEMASAPVKFFLRWAFNDILHACARFHNCDLANKLFLQMHDIGLTPCNHTYGGLIKAVISVKGVTHGMNLIKTMEHKELQPHDGTLASISVGYSKILELDLAESFLDRISDKFPYLMRPFNALLAACDTMDEPDRAIRILAQMRKSNVKLNIRTYALMFSLFGNVNAPYEEGSMLSHVEVSRRISTIESDMSKNEICHRFCTLKNLIRALGAEGMIDEMLKYLNLAESRSFHISLTQKSDLYNIVLDSLVKAGQIHSAIRIFNNMRLYGIPSNTAIYNIMIECCSLLTCSKLAWALVSLMYQDGFVPQIFTYTALIKVLLSEEDFDSVLKLMELIGVEGIQPDIELYNTILTGASAKGRIHVVEHIIEQMHRDRIPPDPATISYTLSAYVDAGLHTTAIEALLVLSMRMISLEPSVLQEYREFYEELVISEDPKAEMKMMELFKKSEEHLVMALLNLRFCAISGYSPISWLPDDSLWARRLSSSYESKRAKWSLN